MTRPTRLTKQAIDVRYRASIPGPERRLVDWFLAENDVVCPTGCEITRFFEPHLESGYPDVVTVVWDTTIAENWPAARLNLAKDDIRLAHLLYERGASPLNSLSAMVGRNVNRNLERLAAAEMILEKDGLWRTRPLSTIFAVRKIITIEAKISQWAKALQQALLNTWFASQSYILLPHLPRGEKLLEAAAKVGVGVWTKASGCVRTSQPKPTKLPHSYGSWLFNELAWRSRYDGENLRLG